eukprot:scaffold183611_cov14-Tisochrysis_lutea.AAC.2
MEADEVKRWHIRAHTHICEWQSPSQATCRMTPPTCNGHGCGDLGGGYKGVGGRVAVIAGSKVAVEG